MCVSKTQIDYIVNETSFQFIIVVVQIERWAQRILNYDRKKNGKGKKDWNIIHMKKNCKRFVILYVFCFHAVSAIQSVHRNGLRVKRLFNNNKLKWKLVKHKIICRHSSSLVTY